MATLLHRLGGAAARHRVLVVVVWLLVLGGAGAAAATLAGTTSSSFSIPGSESAEALDTFSSEFGSSADGATARIVFVAPDGQQVTSPDVAARVTQAVADFAAVPDVVSASDPFDPQQPAVSPDQGIAYSTVTFADVSSAVPAASLDALRTAVDDVRATGLEVEAGGDAFQEVPEVLGPAEVVGVVVAFVVLMLTYGTIVAAGANLLTALIGVGVGAAGVTALTGFVDLQSTTPILAVMLGLAVGIDYALFIFARFRDELRAGWDVDEAVARAVGTAGSAVVFAGLTVVVALSGLSVVGIPFLLQMGLAAAGTVVIAVLVALTLVPALLRFIGLRVLRKRERIALAADASRDAPVVSHDEPGHVAAHVAAGEPPARRRPRVLEAWGRFVTDRPVAALVGAVVVLGVLAAPVLGLQTALPDDSSADPASSQRKAYDLISDGFGPGLNGPLLLLVRSDDAATAGADVAQQVSALDDVAFVTPPQPNADGTAAVVTVIPGSGPTDEATTALVQEIRSTFAGSDGYEVAVTGATAVGIDVDAQLSDALPVYLLLVVGLALVLLVLMFRSVFVPVMATIGFLLSFGAGLGVTTAIYQFGWLSSVFGVAQPAPLMSLLPIITVGILFGLAMDYQVFLVSRMHEAHSHGETPKNAVRLGFRRAAPVVVAAATIMGSVFAGFAGSPDPIIGSIAMTLTVGVLADAFLVRMVVMPAALSLAGRGGWWLPRWLGRVLPHIDVEGRALEQAAPAAGRETVGASAG